MALFIPIITMFCCAISIKTLIEDYSYPTIEKIKYAIIFGLGIIGSFCMLFEIL